MSESKRVSAEEFAAHAAELLEGHEAVTIEKNGEVVGRYVPAPNGHAVSGVIGIKPSRKGSPEARENRKQLDRLLQKIYAEAGLTEEEWVAEFLRAAPTPDDSRSES
jgi:hypothetical protein